MVRERRGPDVCGGAGTRGVHHRLAGAGTGRFADEKAHRKRIGRSFATSTKEVSVEQFLKFHPKHQKQR